MNADKTAQLEIEYIYNPTFFQILYYAQAIWPNS